MLTENLNPQQAQAVLHDDGPLIVVAGAGSGKTRVITCRIAHLIQERGAPPESILAITFTNKAAGEMKERVRNMLDASGSSPWISTFHSFCLRVLRQHIDHLGFSNDFVIYDALDQLSLVKECMKAAQVNTDAFPPKNILNHISRFKNDFLFPNDIDQDSLSFGAKLKAAQLYETYQQGLRKNNALDFDDLLIWTVRLFQEAESVADSYNQRFQHILVDEFQDTNVAQYELVRLLSRVHRDVCVVGDDDQSIYRWRGANLENILHFERDFPGATIIKLEENYRSTQNILNAAGGVVKENTARKPKTLWTKNPPGEPVVYYRAEDELDEAQFVCDKIFALNRDPGISFNDMAVLYRTNAQSRALEDALMKLGVPYQVFGGLKFYSRREIKDILAFLRVAKNPEDSVSMRRIINVPPRGIGKTSLDKIEAHCRLNNLSLIQGLRQAGEKSLVAAGAAKKISQFLGLMDHLAAFSRNGSPLDLLHEVLDRTGYGSMLQKDESREGKTRLENVKELFSAVEQAVEQEGLSIQEFLDSTALVADVDALDDSRGTLPLMTLHTCKGLEFDAVFVVGMENGLLPHNSSMSDNAEYEEERRLCYVGFTRARKNLFVSSARKRRVFGNTLSYPPSDFLLSIPEEVLVSERSALTPSYSVSSYAAAPSIPQAPAPGNRANGSDEGYAVGAKVVHPKFGSGVIINLEGSEDDLKALIFFKQPVGKKKLALKVANLIVL